MYKNRVLRKFSVPKREKTKGGWRKSHKETFTFCTHHQMSGKSTKAGNLSGLAVFGAAESASTFYIVIILNAVTQVRT